MTVTLLVAGEHLSLEFAPGDMDTVRGCIRRMFGDWTAAPAGIASVVRFGGEDFTFQIERDDPCLISSSASGDDLLRRIDAAIREARIE